MTIDEAQRAANGIAYKPGWGFAVFPAHALKVRLSVEAPVVCVESGEKIQIASAGTHWIGDWVEEDLVRAFIDIVIRIERHEVAEHFRFGGLRVAVPHPERGEEKTAFSVSLL